MKTWQIIASAVVLAALGIWLLRTPAATNRTPTAAAATRATPTTMAPTLGSPAPSSSSAPSTAPPLVIAPSSIRPSTEPGDKLAPADGPAGDHLVQALFDAHIHHNLPATLERRLNELGRAVWLADLTGQGRNRWPTYFTTAGTSGYTAVRIQAAVTRATDIGRAEVTLIWAGTSPAGDPEVGLRGTVLLAQRSDGTWEPVR